MSTSSVRTPVSSWDVPRVGEVVAGKYRILSVLGQGGLAIVLSAMHEQLEERVALKILLPEWSDNEDVVARFLREGRASIKIHSEHVVRIFDVGETDTRAPFIVMEYLDGNDLAKVLTTKGALQIETAVDHIAQACEAMAEAHALSIIHRDLKPANLFLTHRADGSPCVKVLDFGISKIGKRHSRTFAMTSPSMVMGSPHYMSPEQLQSSAAADERSDVWALGACLHELLAGEPPFQGDTAPELCAHVLTDAPPQLSALRADVPEGLQATVLTALEKEPSKRFPNVGELAKAIAQYGSPVAVASAERAARVLELSGIARTSDAGGVQHDATRVSTSHIREITDSDGYRVRKGHPVLIGVTLILLLAGLVIGALFFVKPSLFRGPVVTSPPPAAAAATAAVAPPSSSIEISPPEVAAPKPAPPLPPVPAVPVATTRRPQVPTVAYTAPPAEPAIPIATATALPVPPAIPTPTPTSTDGLFDDRK